MSRIRIGTRGSRLALEQASLVQEALRRADSRIETEIIVLRTKGDKIQDKPLSEIGDKGVFASEFEQALLKDEIDIAVHSAKDLPAVLAAGLTIAAVLPRADVRDVLVVPKGGRLPLAVEYGTEVRETPDIESHRAFVIGTGSRRRQLQAGQLWTNVTCENIRGNVDTRLRKLQEGSYDGIILAKAGLNRLRVGTDSGRREEFTFCPLPPGQFLPAACQGIIAVEAVRDSDAAVLCREITDPETELCFLVEREVLSRLSADCSEAAAAWCRREQEVLVLDVMYAGNRKRLTMGGDLQDVKKDAACQTKDAAGRKAICLTSDGKKSGIGPVNAVDGAEIEAGLEMARQAAALVKRKEKEQI